MTITWFHLHTTPPKKPNTKQDKTSPPPPSPQKNKKPKQQKNKQIKPLKILISHDLETLSKIHFYWIFLNIDDF